VLAVDPDAASTRSVTLGDYAAAARGLNPAGERAGVANLQTASRRLLRRTMKCLHHRTIRALFAQAAPADAKRSRRRHQQLCQSTPGMGFRRATRRT
jgi:hypothetical protein